jgi:putative phosphoesterase
MKIGVIADTHISDRRGELPDKVLLAFKEVDLVIHAGDLVDLRVLDLLRRLSKEVKAVYGNMDPGGVREKLPVKQVISIGKHRVGVMHGYGNPRMLVDVLAREFKSDNVDLIIFGHSHEPLNLKKDDCLYFNPGSPTDKVFAPYNSFGIIEINDKIEARIIKI